MPPARSRGRSRRGAGGPSAWLAGRCSTAPVGVTRTSSPATSAVPSTSSVKPLGSGGGKTSVTAVLPARLASVPFPGPATSRTPSVTVGSTVTTLTVLAAPTVRR